MKSPPIIVLFRFGSLLDQACRSTKRFPEVLEYWEPIVMESVGGLLLFAGDSESFVGSRVFSDTNIDEDTIVQF